MNITEKKPSLLWAAISLLLPISVILYGTVIIGIRPPVLPLIAAIALAGILCRCTGYTWKELQEGMFEALARVQIAVAILVMVGMIISAWLASGTIPAIVYWGLKLIAPEYFLVSTLFLCSIASVATGTSFATMGTIGVALLGVGTTLGYPPAMTVGAIVSGAYIGDKVSPVSDSTNITAAICEVPLFQHIYSLLWTTAPSFLVAAVAYYFLGASYASSQSMSLDSLGGILAGLETAYSLGWWAFIPPVLMISLAYMRFPVLPVMLVCLISGVVIALFEGHSVSDLTTYLTTGFKAATGTPRLDALLSRGGIMSTMPTIILLCCGISFGGILEKARVLEVLLDALLRGAKSTVRLVTSTVIAGYLINFGTGSQMLAVIVPGRALLQPFRKAGIHGVVLSRSCEDGGTIGCPLIPWSVHAFYILGILNVSAYEFAPYAIVNWVVPVFSVLCAVTGLGIWHRDGSPANHLLRGIEPEPAFEQAA